MFFGLFSCRIHWIDHLSGIFMHNMSYEDYKTAQLYTWVHHPRHFLLKSGYLGFSPLLNSFLVQRSWNFGCSLSSGQYLTYLTFFRKIWIFSPFLSYFLVSAYIRTTNYAWQIARRAQLRQGKSFFTSNTLKTTQKNKSQWISRYLMQKCPKKKLKNMLGGHPCPPRALKG